MTHYVKNGSKYTVTAEDAIDLHDHLPVGTYTIKYNEMGGFYFLETVEGFTLPPKLYGNTVDMSARILNSFADRSASTGVMLSGEKGSGKTLLAKKLSIDAAEHGIPTIVINQPWNGDTFNGFMQNIEQPVVVIFDEFEKVYDSKEQEKLLTLLDGVYPSKKLFIITCNDKWRVNEHMKNRPGRIYYRLDYKGLATEFIVEYCEDNLNNKEHIETICKLSLLYGEFNFDILKAMVEEMNRYNESPQQVMAVLNAKPELDSGANFHVDLEVDAKKIKDLESPTWSGNPLSGTIHIYYEDGEKWSTFNPVDLVKVDAESGKFYFEKKKTKLSLIRAKSKSVDYSAF